jgi:enoyl-CoA hydratase
MFYSRPRRSSVAPHLLVERDGPIVVLTLNRPEARNAFDAEMLVRLDAWDLIDGDDGVRCAVLTGAGGHFCAGTDLKLMASGYADDEWRARLTGEKDLHWKAFLRSYRLRKPLVSAVEGYALAGGLEILQATDVRVVAASAKLGVPEARWGLFPLGGSTVRLRRQIPHTLAMELLLTGRMMSAEEAQRVGLVGRVVPDGQALTEARRIAGEIAANGPLAVQAIKRSVLETDGMPEEQALARELEIGWPILSTDDAKEGPRAFAEKRRPEFKGK